MQSNIRVARELKISNPPLIRIVFSLLLPELERYKETVKRGVLAAGVLGHYLIQLTLT